MSDKKRKICIIGAGAAGSSCAWSVIKKNIDTSRNYFF